MSHSKWWAGCATKKQVLIQWQGGGLQNSCMLIQLFVFFFTQSQRKESAADLGRRLDFSRFLQFLNLWKRQRYEFFTWMPKFHLIALKTTFWFCRNKKLPLQCTNQQFKNRESSGSKTKLLHYIVIPKAFSSKSCVGAYFVVISSLWWYLSWLGRGSRQQKGQWQWGQWHYDCSLKIEHLLWFFTGFWLKVLFPKVNFCFGSLNPPLSWKCDEILQGKSFLLDLLCSCTQNRHNLERFPEAFRPKTTMIFNQ